MRNLLFVVLLSFLIGCSYVSVHTPTTYKGKPATKPYVQLPPQDTILMGCDRQLNTCMAVSQVTPHVHNPLSLPVEGEVTCKFEASNDKLEGREETRSSRLIKLARRSSLKVDVKNSFIVPADEPTFLSTSCWFRYRVLKYEQ